MWDLALCSATFLPNTNYLRWFHFQCTFQVVCSGCKGKQSTCSLLQCYCTARWMKSWIFQSSRAGWIWEVSVLWLCCLGSSQRWGWILPRFLQTKERLWNFRSVVLLILEKDIIIKYQHRKSESQEYAPTSAQRLQTLLPLTGPLVPSVPSQ